MRPADRGPRARRRASGSGRSTASAPGCSGPMPRSSGSTAASRSTTRPIAFARSRRRWTGSNSMTRPSPPSGSNAAISRAKNDLRHARGTRQARRATTWTTVAAKVYEAYQERLRAVLGRRFRRPARPHGHDPQGTQGRPRRARRAVSLRPGRRVPGHQPRAVRDRPGPVRRPPQPLRHGRPRPVDLRLARGEHRAISSNSSRTSPAAKVVKLERNYRSTKNILRDGRPPDPP